MGGPPSEIDGVPDLRPLALMRDAGLCVHAVAPGQAAERRDVDGVTVWIEPSTPRLVRRIVSLRAQLMFIESIAYGVPFGQLAHRSWARNPQPAAHPGVRRLQQLSLRQMDALSFTNPAAEAQWRFDPRRLVDLPYPVDVPFWSTPVPRRDSWWTDRGRPAPVGPVFTCNAAYVRLKRVCELLEMMAPVLNANRSAILVFVGHPLVEPDIAQWLVQRPQALGIGEQVLTTGWVSREELRELLAWTSVSIINSSSETQCLAVYESLVAGVVCLISDIPQLTSQFPALPAHADGAQLRANIARVLADRSLQERLLERTSQRVLWSDVRRHDAVFIETLERLLGLADRLSPAEAGSA